MRPETRLNSTAPEGLEAPNRLVGYAAVFGVESAPMWDAEVCKGPFVEVILPGAFARSLITFPDVRALFDHKPGLILGRTKNKTLTLIEDAIGLHFDLLLPDTQPGRDARELIKRRDIDGCSFGMFVLEDRLTMRPGLPALRELVEVHCYEITPATAFPAYGRTQVELRSIRHIDGTPAPVSRPTLDLAAARLRLSRS